jgi:asparagine synthase (glutamine-hydrolysing)
MSKLLSPARLDAAGLFDAGSVAKLIQKCRTGRAIGFGDNIAFVGVLSSMLLHEQYIKPTGALTAPG